MLCNVKQKTFKITMPGPNYNAPKNIMIEPIMAPIPICCVLAPPDCKLALAPVFVATLPS